MEIWIVGWTSLFPYIVINVSLIYAFPFRCSLPAFCSVSRGPRRNWVKMRRTVLFYSSYDSLSHSRVWWLCQTERKTRSLNRAIKITAWTNWRSTSFVYTETLTTQKYSVGFHWDGGGGRRGCRNDNIWVNRMWYWDTSRWGHKVHRGAFSC